MTSTDPTQRLSRRERQIMDVIYRRGRATAAEVQEELPDPPGYSAVRSALSLLEERGLLRHEEEGRRYVYLPATPPRKASARALDHVLRTFFGGSRARAVAALMDDPREMSEEELAELGKLVARARRERKP